MIHSLALSLIFSSLLAAHVWSPNPKEDVIVKQGHRVIVVESYEQDGHPNTKVSISPPQDPASSAGFVKDKVKQGISLTKGAAFQAKDRVKDAYDKASEMAHNAEETVENAYGTAKGRASEKAHGAKEFVGDAYGKATDAAHEAKEVVENAYVKATDKAQEKAHRAKEAVEDAYEKTKDFAAHKARDAKETVSNQVKDKAKTTIDFGKTIRTNVSQQVRGATRIFKGLKDLSSWLDPLFGVTNLLGLAIAYGTGMWVTFVSSHVLGGSLPRHQFGLVQSKMYPMYFRAMGLSIMMTLLGHIGGHRETLFSQSKAGRLRVYNLLASLLAVLVNAIYLEPLATKAMMEKFKLEKEEGRGREMQAPERSRAEEAAVTGTVETAIGRAREAQQQEQRKSRERMAAMKQKLKKLNSYSSLLNILTLAGLSWHLAHLGHCLHRAS